MTKKQVLDNEAWVGQAAVKRRKCMVCNNAEVMKTLRDLLNVIKERKAFHISLRAIYDRVESLNPGFQEGCSGPNLRNHLNHHEPLWHCYKGERVT